ncbi:MAG: bacteriohemerythrin [Desulfobulbaceae bacterium]|nr:bacteriohemerythrin [Desulfobulbaceae bacterium]
MSDIFEWKPEYSIGVASVDNQHQEIFHIFNKLANAVANGNSPKAAAAAMHEMSKYLDKHFTFEEPLLQKHPDFDRHHLEHLKFIENTLDFQIRFADKDTNVHTDMLAFLFDWLKKHILEMDKEYFDYLKENNLLDN